MRVIMVKDRFVDAIKDGVKTTTIRKNARCLVGDEISIRVWAGKPYRSKHREIYKTRCADIKPVLVQETSLFIGTKTFKTPAALAVIARKEGFSDWNEMVSFFKDIHGLPFAGAMISWNEEVL